MQITLSDKAEDLKHPVRVGDYGNPGLRTFSEAYLAAARSLEKAGVLENGEADCLPVLFLWRHGVELRLKDCLLNAWQARKVSNGEERLAVARMIDTEHNLGKLLEKIERQLRQVGQGEIQVSGSLRNNVVEVNELDPASINFRYPLISAWKSLEKDLRAQGMSEAERKQKLADHYAVVSPWKSTFNDAPFLEYSDFMAACNTILEELGQIENHLREFRGRRS